MIPFKITNSIWNWKQHCLMFTFLTRYFAWKVGNTPKQAMIKKKDCPRRTRHFKRFGRLLWHWPYVTNNIINAYDLVTSPQDRFYAIWTSMRYFKIADSLWKTWKKERKKKRSRKRMRIWIQLQDNLSMYQLLSANYLFGIYDKARLFDWYMFSKGGQNDSLRKRFTV